MSEILTAEQVENTKLTLPLTPWSHSNRVTLSQLCASHEALREQLAEAQADVWALAALLPDLDIACSHCKNRIDEALARPGVQRIMEEQETE